MRPHVRCDYETNARKEDGMKLMDEKAIAKQFAVNWLNRQGGEPLPDDYFTSVDVMFDSREDEPILLLEFNSNDDGGPARMLCYISNGRVAWGAWYFDGTWGEMHV